MRTVLTGVSGFVGSQLIGLLATRGHELLLVGRNPSALSEAWPEHATCSYEDLPARGKGFDQLVHLAVLNNDAEADEADFFRVNVDFALDTLRRARDAGIGRFINVSSMLALGDSDHPYARSKRAAAAALHAEDGITCITAYLPAVHGERWAGRLAPLNRLPRLLSRPIFLVLAALRPVVHVNRLADFCNRTDRVGGSVYVADNIDDNIVYRLLKRSMDLGCALIILLLFWWALAAVWVAIRLQADGPGIFAQTRIGRLARPFTCYKFRTMRVGTAEAGTHQVSQSAVTPLGSFLRRTKIDELPQVWNILLNEISLVGPRPCLVGQTHLIKERDARGVFSVKPGITGLAQINDIDMSDPERLADWDARYVATRSLLLDIRILLRTALGGGQGDKVKVSDPAA